MNDNMENYTGGQMDLAATESLDISASALASAPAVQQTKNLADNIELLTNIAKVARIYAKSSVVPSTYQNNPDNCFVAVEIAGRMGVSPTLVMQNLVVVQGRPAWSGQSCIALVNGCGKFAHDLDFVFVGEPGTDAWGCRCETVRKSDGRKLAGTTITIETAKAENWFGKAGSKWKTIPQQMLMYRAASWFARTYCPEVLMGFSTADEAEDIAPEPQATHIQVDGK